MPATPRPPLHVLLTLDCAPQGARCHPNGPPSWDASGRAIDAFCTTAMRAGLPPTLFVTPETAHEHEPLLGDLRAGGAEVGLLLQPPSLRQGGYKHYLGAYERQAQARFVDEARDRFGEAFGQRPRSVRSAMYSASDDTFPVLDGAGFRQSSLSSPGRRTPKYHAVWDGAPADAHRASATDRLRPGALPLLEVPVTTDAGQRQGGLSPDLAIENGTVPQWHEPLIEGQLARQTREGVPLTLCFVSSSAVAFHDRAGRPRQTLEALVELLRRLDLRYEVLPTTLAGAYAHLTPPPSPHPATT